MKNMITIVPCVLILTSFALQFQLDQVNIHRRYNVEKCVDTALVDIRHDGYVSPITKKTLKEEIAKIMRVEPADVDIEGTSSVKYRQNTYSRSQMIHYKVTAPVNRIIVANDFYGISDSQNKGTVVVEGYVASERLAP